MADDTSKDRLHDADLLGGKSPQFQAIETLIGEHFNGDVQAAVREMRQYLLDVRAKQGQPKRTPAPAGHDRTALLSVRGITKTYKRGRQQVPALKGLNFDIYKGEFIAITGASGSGKSTLLQLLGGLDKPTAGEVFYEGINLAKLPDRKLSAFRRQTVGFVFQFFYLQPFLRLERNLEVPGMFSRMKRKLRQERSLELAKQVGLEDRLHHFPRELSGGQTQRAAVARALFNQPKILLADEPTGNLDSKSGEAVISLFETIRRELDTTVVIVTHDAEIARRADRVIHIKDGEMA